ncbi:tRNA (adenosine(37)-N6)-dimethylallyltransferase MiaA [Jatrophihabitans endophyticus]|uniref:tRNA (adenosine(37)-N6)-dimethylallyltransferase MiaA n=1 Tax=Jatrophihabitans endophyticus TaxID=1206085 RepID=UPI0019FDA22D|nr:tRNA (adenosine(37)-N6)-dimethylallyltransferase MiaA [Jatrophihabitans endophyticus]MBE7190239.1 tRNA (adenosine(37)-N6)-dimethylallyltransferase MiaA [Jatrophihabitans endophyticus]
MPEPGGRVLAVVGPTATGKSDLAVALARRLDGEIVNADSMQLYVGMDVGTAKLPVDERGGVPHHLLDVWPLEKSAAVAQYQALARERIADIHARHRLPVLVGGSGLYLRGALDDLEFPGESPAVRAGLYAALEDAGPEALHARLAQVDPVAAAAILPSNGRRIVRALEVIEITGAPFTARMPGFDSIYDTVQIGLDRDDLGRRVELRVRRMMAGGLLDEIRGLLPLGLRASPTAGKALGYQQLLAVLDDDGRVTGDLDEAVELTVRGTKRFVKRQRTWFRRDPRVHWLDASAPDLTEQALRVAGGA